MESQVNPLKRKVEQHVDELFAGVGESQQLIELKEELATNLKEKIADYKARGRNDEEAFKEAVVSIGDLSDLIDDMRAIGRDKSMQAIYSSTSSTISTVGIIVGVLAIVFGILSAVMLYFMEIEAVAIPGSGIFIVFGGALFTYSVLTRETARLCAMNKVYASLYAAGVALILFAIFLGLAVALTDEPFVGIASFTVFFLAGVGLILGLILFGASRKRRSIES